MQEYNLKVTSEEQGMRLDQFLANYCEEHKLGFSRTKIQKAICKGKVKIRGLEKLNPNYKIKSDEEVFFSPEEERAAQGLSAESIPLEVVYDDINLAIINKPAGLVVHPGAGNLEHTLVNALLARFPGNLSSVNPERPGIVHRLDKETSGILVIAKTNDAHFSLSKQFAEHSIKRKYMAVVNGEMEFDENIIEASIARHPIKRENMSVSYSEGSRYARTRYRTLKRTKSLSLVELEPFTGRTHQLRVHMAFLGHPILGDTKYAKNNSSKRLFLHAFYLGFIHPGTKKFIDFTCSIPSDFKDIIK